jgi:hypothetical protein
MPWPKPSAIAKKTGRRITKAGLVTAWNVKRSGLMARGGNGAGFGFGWNLPPMAPGAVCQNAAPVTLPAVWKDQTHGLTTFTVLTGRSFGVNGLALAWRISTGMTIIDDIY